MGTNLSADSSAMMAGEAALPGWIWCLILIRVEVVMRVLLILKIYTYLGKYNQTHTDDSLIDSLSSRNSAEFMRHLVIGQHFKKIEYNITIK